MWKLDFTRDEIDFDFVKKNILNMGKNIYEIINQIWKQVVSIHQLGMQ